MQDNSNGRKWARIWLVIALSVSVIANVTHACLAESSISLWLRVPGAMIWPLFTFAGIEVVVRMIWEKRLPHTATQWVLMSAAVPAAITSYEHQYTLLGMMGENGFIQGIGPLAIDGLMIGCTMALLFTRTTIERAERLQYAKPIGPMPASTPAIAPSLSIEEELERITLAEVLPQPAPMLITGAGKSHLTAEDVKRRIPRASNGQTDQLVRDMLEDPKLTAPNSTIRRYSSVARTLRDNPRADLGMVRGVRHDIVENIIRPWAMSERVR